MRAMFYNATAFNQAVNSWDTSAVTDMSSMFSYARAFNQPVDSWDTSAVTDMFGMFYRATAFNQCIGTWAGKTPDDVRAYVMFQGTSCPDVFDPDPSKGPWCQGSDICSVGPTQSPSGSPTFSPSPTTLAPTVPIVPTPVAAPTDAPVIPTNAPTAELVAAPSDTPTLNPSPTTLAPTSAPLCEDAPNSAKFDYVNKKNQTRKSCSFIEEFLEGATKILKNKICNLDAKPPARGKGITKATKIRLVCPRACGICPDQCKDSNRKYILEGKQRKCSFLDKRRPAVQKDLCNTNVGLIGGNPRKPKLRSLCQARCAKVGIGRCAIPTEEDIAV